MKKIIKLLILGIALLLSIADLQLSPFPEASASIYKALNAKDPMERYWALITSSAFGEQADEFTEKAIELAASDSNRLVRVRAAEFLGLTGAADPLPILLKALDECSDPIEANLILNTVVLG